MNSTEEIYGALLFFRKDGQPSTKYPLSEGKITIGSSRDADIRLKMNDKRLEEVHCVIEVNDIGIATLFNKSVSEPVKINSISIRKNKILKNDDEIEFVGKKFMYLNENSSKKSSDKNAKKTRSTPSQKRYSSTLTSLKREKKSSNFKTKIPVQVRPSTSRSYASTSSDFTVTYENEHGIGTVLDRSNTTSKVIVSKVVRSPSSKKRRLSFGDQPQKYGRSPKMSTRNILLSKNIISTITEEEKSTSPRPSVSMSNLDKSLKQNEWNQSPDSNDLSSEDLIKLELSVNSSVSPILSSPGYSTPSSSKKSPSTKSSTKIPKDRISISRNSLLQQCLQNNQDKSLKKSKGSSRKSKTEEFNEQFPSEDSPISKKKEQLGEKFLSGESKKQSPSKGLLLTPESHTPNKLLRKSRHSLNKSKTVKPSDQSFSRPTSRKTLATENGDQEKELLRTLHNEESPIFDIFKSQSPNKPSVRARQSRMSMGKQEKHSEEQSLSESKSLKLKPRSKSYSIVKNESHQNPSRRLSISLTNLKISNSEVCKERRFSVRKSFKAADLQAGESPHNISIRKSNRLTGSKEFVQLNEERSNGLNEDEDIEELSSSEESLMPDVSILCEKETSMQTLTAPKEMNKLVVRENSKLSDSDNEDLSSSEEFFTLNISPMSTTKETCPKETVSSVRMRKSRKLNREEQAKEQSYMEESIKLNTSALNSSNKVSKQTPATTPKETRTSLKKSRVSSIRNSNRSTRGDENEELPSSNQLSEDEEIDKQSGSEESFVLNISPTNSPEKTSIKGFSTTPKGTVISMNPSKDRISSVRKSNRLNTYEENNEITSLVSMRTSTEKSSPVRRSDKLNRDENIGRLSFSEVFLDSESNTSKELSAEIYSVMTPKQIPSARTPTKRLSSVGKNSKLNEDVDTLILHSSLIQNVSTVNRRSLVRKNTSVRDEVIEELSPGKKLPVSNVFAMNTPKEISAQARLTTTPKELPSVRISDESRSSARKSNRLNRKEDDDLSSGEESSVQNVSAVNRRFSVRKNKSSRYKDLEEPSSSEECLISNVSVKNTPKKTSVQARLTTTPKELVTSVRISNKSRSSARKSNKLNQKEENVDLSSSEESSVQNVSAVNKRSSVRKNKLILDGEVGELSLGVSAMNTPKEMSVQRRLTITPKELVTSVRLPNGSSSSVRKSIRVSREEEIDILSCSEESLVLSVSTSDSPTGKSMRKLSTTSKGRRASSVMEGTKSITDEEMNKLSSSEESLVYPVNDNDIDKQSSITERNIRRNESQSPNRDSVVFFLSDSKNSTPIPASHRKNIANEIFEHSNYSSQAESDFSVESPHDRITPKLRHPSVRKNHLNTQDEISETETSVNKSSRSTTSSIRRSNKSMSASKVDKVSLTHSKQNISVITLNDSNELTPENNSSVIIINASLENTRKSSHKRLSKTLNSTLQDDVELTTPKSAIKNRRPKSLPYNPLIEDITPVSPLGKSKNDSGFKTPLNTPGLFEDIKKSVLRSRSQMQNSSTNLTGELSKIESPRGSKRPLVDESYVESSKRRKLMQTGTSETFDTSQEVGDGSFESFSTDDVLTNITQQNISQNTPKHFSDLTDKPVITHPQIRSSVEPKGKKSKSLRESSYSVRLSSHATTDGSARDDIVSQTNSSLSRTNSSSDLNDSVFDTTSDIRSRRSSRFSLRSQSTQDDSPVRMPRTPKNDLSDVAGLKKLLKSPNNELINVPNLRPLTAPKTNNSPRNDPANVVVKKLLTKPKQMKSPENDLRRIPNLRNFLSPKQQNSPKNDLSDVVGVKKLLSTPNAIKSPKNDLRNIPNLRRLMSPTVQSSPKNDLNDVRGVKKLFSTPKSQKTPKNDLTNVPNLRRIMSPKQQNTPRNDLTDVYGLKEMMATPGDSKELQNDKGENIFNVSGVQRLSIESDIENNEDLFGKLFAKKPLKTYRGKSLSPASRKTMLFDNKRKTLGDVPVTSPRVKKWIEDQAVIKLKRIEDIKKTQGTPTITGHQEEFQKRRVRDRRMEKNTIEESLTSEELAGKGSKVCHTRAVRGKRKLQEISTDHMVDSTDEGNSTSELEFKLPHVTRGRIKKMSQDEMDQIPEVHSTTQDIKSPAPKRAKPRRGKNIKVVNEEEEQTNPVIAKKTRGRKQNMMVASRSKPDFYSEDTAQIVHQSDSEGESTKIEKDSKAGKRNVGKNRKKLQDKETEGEEKMKLANEEKQTTPVIAKRTRGRKQNVVLASESKPDISSEEMAHIVHQRNREVQISKVEKDSKAGKRKVGKNTKKVADKETESEENILAVNEEEQIIPVVTKRTRVRKQNVLVDVVSKPDGTSEEPTQIVHHSDSEVDITEVQKARKGGKRKVGKNKTKVAVNETENEGEVKVANEKEHTSPLITKRTRGRKQNLMVTSESKTDTTSEETEETIHENDIEVEISKGKKDSRVGKRKVGKNKIIVAVNETESEGEVKVLNEEKQATPIIAKRTRSRKQNGVAPEPEPSKQTAEFIDQSDTEIETFKVQKAGKRKIGRKKEKVLAEKETQSDDQKEAKSVKSTRGRKQLAVHEYNEEEENKVTGVKSNKKKSTKEEMKNMEEEEKSLAKPTRGRRPIDKVKLVEESPVDSPRTARAKRGNFNKYGSDFLMEQETMEETKGKKRVRFDENEKSTERKGKDKNVANPEEVEGTIRKSKRTRK